MTIIPSALLPRKPIKKLYTLSKAYIVFVETIVIIQSIIEKKLISLILWKNSSRQSFCQQNLIIADRQPYLRSMKIYRLLCFTTIVCFFLVCRVYKTIESITKEVLTLFEYY